MKIKKDQIITVISFILVTFPMFSQSGWDIKYNPINLLNKSFINQQMLIDFKSDQNDNIDDRTNSILTNNSTTNEDRFLKTLEVRELLNRPDEFQISIGNTNLTFIEIWKIDLDQGFLSNQRYFNKENDKEFIRNITLTTINDDLLIFTADFYTSDTNFTTIEFIVSKDKVKGFLTLL